LRFRHKLSIVLVGLALVPLIAAGIVVSGLLEHDQVARVDGRLATAAAAGQQAYRSLLQQATAAAIDAARRTDIQAAMRAGRSVQPPPAPLGATLTVMRGTRRLGGPAPAPPPAWRFAQPVGACADCHVIASVPLDARLASSLLQGVRPADSIQFALVSGGRILASSDAARGRATGLRAGTAADAHAGATSVRALAAGVQCADGARCLIVAAYPRSALNDAIDSQRLRLLVPLLIVAAILAVLAYVAADWMSRALGDLAQRARGLAPAGPQGDELDQLGAAIDEISTELSSRVGELEAERGRFKETLQRYGDTLAATHDLNALVGAVLDTAVQATRSRGGRLMLYDPERGEAVEQARIGTARGSRADLPMVVTAGDGVEGAALAAHESRTVQAPRAMLAVPILREHHLLGLVTAVDPQEGAFGDDDVEVLSALAVQAGVAIENARLHQVVERQAVTDALTGLANRRQFYEVLGREYERAQRFGTPLSLILLDVDDFKHINDERGHLAGDAVLHGVASSLGDMIREIDLAARYGGEEFAVLLPQTDKEGAAHLAERLRVAIEARTVHFGGAEISGITSSFGVASGPKDGTTQIDLIATADAALYQAKREGKNRVVVSSEW
jgi:two-component system, cell cycle response regulator